MSRLSTLNKRLLEVLGLSSESAQIVIEHIEELKNEAGSLRTENILLRQDIEECRTLMRRALPTIESRITDYEDSYRAACTPANTP